MLIHNNPDIDLIEEFTENGEHSGYGIRVNDKTFGLATYCTNQSNEDVYVVLSGVGQFETYDSESLEKELIYRINFVKNIIQKEEK